MSLSLKKLLAIIMILFLSFFMTNYSYAAGEKQKIKTIEQQRREMQKKIDSLKKLERKEANKLSLNQQKLEKNQMALKRSKNQYSAKQANITNLKKELNTYLNQYNTRQNSSAERIRCIYKSKHSPVLDILVSTDSLSDFLDRIYYQNLIIKSDREKMLALKAEAKKVATAKQRLENEQKELSKIIRDIDRENSNIQVTIQQNKSIIEKIQKDKRAYEKSER